ncbi:MAG: TRAP transporter small permease [Betaproteobacteria bacterium]|nr:TRAP transporter small permease [Betaproteobacteria bacterium]
MTRAIDLFFRLLELLIVACLVAMVIMVFGNVMLRFTMNTGILISEEMSRYCFIWLIFIGAMAAMREKTHVGVDILIRILPHVGKKACLLLSESLMLMINCLFFIGTWKMHELQVTNVSVVVGLSMIWVYGIGYVVSVVMALMNLKALFDLLAGRLPEDDLNQENDSVGTIEVKTELQERKG